MMTSTAGSTIGDTIPTPPLAEPMVVEHRCLVTLGGLSRVGEGGAQVN